MRFLLVAALVAATLAGCLSDDGDPDDLPALPDGLGSAAPLDLPPKCADGQLSTIHTAGIDGMTPAWLGQGLPVTCPTTLDALSVEPTMGVTASGAVYHYPVMYETVPGSVVISSIGAAVSRDNGETWEDVFPSVAGVPAHQITLDPYFFIDPTTDRIFADDLLPAVNCSLLSMSDDDGASWIHSYSGCLETDHQTLFAGPSSLGITVGYPNVVYRCAINVVALAGTSTMSTCQKSIDGGITWLPPGEPAFVTPLDRLPDICRGGVGHGVVGPDGRVFVPAGFCGQPHIAYSDDEGLTFTQVQIADTGVPNDLGIPAHEVSVAVDTVGTVYSFWIGADGLPYIAVSTDNGASWADPIMVGPPGLIQARLPMLTAGGAGKVAWAYYGSYDAPEVASDNAEDYSESSWSGIMAATWNALDDVPIIASAAVNPADDPLVRGYCGAIRCGVSTDFFDIVPAPDGSLWSPFVEMCIDACAAGDELTQSDTLAMPVRLWGGPSIWDDDDPNGLYP